MSLIPSLPINHRKTMILHRVHTTGMAITKRLGFQAVFLLHLKVRYGLLPISRTRYNTCPGFDTNSTFINDNYSSTLYPYDLGINGTNALSNCCTYAHKCLQCLLINLLDTVNGQSSTTLNPSQRSHGAASSLITSPGGVSFLDTYSSAST
jgi:hypothetical protein